MEHIEMLSTVFKVHNARESLLVSLISHKVDHTLLLEDEEYMREVDSEWTSIDNDYAIHNNLVVINSYLTCCYYLDMIETPFKTFYTIDELKDLH